LFSALKKTTLKHRHQQKNKERERKKKAKASIFNSGQVDTEDKKNENSSTMIHTE